MTQLVIWRSLPTHTTTVVKFKLQISITGKSLTAWTVDQISYFPSVGLCLPHREEAQHSDTAIYTDISETAEILYHRTASGWSAPSCTAARLYSSQISGFAFSFGGPCKVPDYPLLYPVQNPLEPCLPSHQLFLSTWTNHRPLHQLRNLSFMLLSTLWNRKNHK